METKKCSNCKEEKPLSEFSKKSSTKDGLHYRCKPCLSEYSKRYNKKYNKSKAQPRTKATPEELEARKQKAREHSKKYYEANKEKVKEQQKKYKAEFRKKNPNHAQFKNIEKALGKKSKVWRPGM